MSWTSKVATVTGLELNDSLIRFVTLQGETNNLTVSNFGEQAIPHGLFHNGQVVNQAKAVKFLSQIRQIIGQTPINIALPDFHYHYNPSSWCQDLRQVFEQAGFEVNHLECESDAVKGVCDLPVASPYYGAARVDSNHTSLAVKHEHNFNRSHKINVGHNTAIRNIQKNSGLTNQEAKNLARKTGLLGGLHGQTVIGGAAPTFSVLADELRELLNQQPLSIVYVYGESLQWPGVTDYLNDRLPAQVEPLPIKERVKKVAASVWTHDLFHNWLVAFGVALKHVVR